MTNGNWQANEEPSYLMKRSYLFFSFCSVCYWCPIPSVKRTHVKDTCEPCSLSILLQSLYYFRFFI